MLLAKTKLKSSNKIEFMAGLTVNLLFLWLVSQFIYYIFNNSSVGKLDILNLVVSAISFFIAYFLFSDNGYSKKHVGSLEWYKNALHIKKKYVIETCLVFSSIACTIATFALCCYLLSFALQKSSVAFNPYFVEICLYVIIVNTYSMLTALKMDKMEIFSDDLLKINNITELSKIRRAELKELITDKIKNEGSITRKNLSLIIEYIEKEHNRYKNKEKGLYDDFIKAG